MVPIRQANVAFLAGVIVFCMGNKGLALHIIYRAQVGVLAPISIVQVLNATKYPHSVRSGDNAVKLTLAKVGLISESIIKVGDSGEESFRWLMGRVGHESRSPLRRPDFSLKENFHSLSGRAAAIEDHHIVTTVSATDSQFLVGGRSSNRADERPLIFHNGVGTGRSSFCGGCGIVSALFDQSQLP